MSFEDFKNFLINILHLAALLLIFVVIFVPLERLFAVRPQKIWRKGILTDLGYYFVSSLFPAILLSVPMACVAWGARQVIPESFTTYMGSLPVWARILITGFVGETGYYWGHRWSHEFPFLWRFHVIHHSAEHIDFLVNTRSHPIDMVFNRFCQIVPVYLIGLSGPHDTTGNWLTLLTTLVAMVWGYFIHANVRWRFGPLEWLLASPAFHHWHHTRTGPINRNYSSTLPVIDWVFGTFYLPNHWPESYGSDTKIPDNLADQLTYPILGPFEESPAAPQSTSTTVVESKKEPELHAAQIKAEGSSPTLP